jgi:hypothetical protein
MHAATLDIRINWKHILEARLQAIGVTGILEIKLI